MANSLFDFLGSITGKKVYYAEAEDLKGYSSYMVNRFLMSVKSFVPVISEINTEYVLTDRMHYDLLFHAIPKSNIFLKYNFKKASKEEEMLNVMKYFNVDLQRAKTYISLMSLEELKSINEFYNNRGMSEKIKVKKKK